MEEECEEDDDIYDDAGILDTGKFSNQEIADALCKVMDDKNDTLTFGPLHKPADKSFVQKIISELSKMKKSDITAEELFDLPRKTNELLPDDFEGIK